MKEEILYRPMAALGRVFLDGGEELRVEGGSMASMTQGITIETRMQGGFFSSLARSLFGGESFFMNVFKAPPQGGVIEVAPTLPGDMFAMKLASESLLIHSGAFVACETGIEIDTTWAGAKGFFASDAFVMLRAKGSGLLMLSCYGAIHEMVLQPGQVHTVDTGHLVAFTDGIQTNVRKVGGMKSTLFSGEGLVVDLTGPGKFYLQTRSLDAFLSWLIPQIPHPEAHRP